MSEERLISAARSPEDTDAALRPKTLDDFVGQKAARDNLRVFIQAAKARAEALDHVLFFGPPGLGKTTLAQIIARDMGVGFRATSGPVIAISKKATSSSSTRFIAWRRRSRKYSIRRWRIARSTS